MHSEDSLILEFRQPRSAIRRGKSFRDSVIQKLTDDHRRHKLSLKCTQLAHLRAARRCECGTICLTHCCGTTKVTSNYSDRGYMNSVRLIAFCLCSLIYGAVHAAPIYFQVNLKVGNESPSHPLAGASIQLNTTFDVSPLTPLEDISAGDHRTTTWRTATSSISMDVTGSSSHDGHHVGALSSSPSFPWELSNNHPTLGDYIEWPRFGFQLGTSAITFEPLRAMFGVNHFTNAGPLVPIEFDATDATWTTPHIGALKTDWSLSTSQVVGFATFVPEPAMLTTGSFALISLTALRRRK
jgi:hypothetical protein